jgi:hyaluronoglucosaminidase
VTPVASGGSPFAIRGVIEGFYGNPWTHAQRLELVPFIAARGMNTFIYGPKDDPLVRRDWRVPYDGVALTRLRELVATCRAHGVELVYCVSPGLSIEYSSEADAAALSAKLASVAALGVHRFGLLLDDIPLELQHEADRSSFGGLVEAHATLIDRVLARLDDGQDLIVCPTVYFGYGDESYVARLGTAIGPRVDLFWTGREICSHVLDLDDARRFQAATGHAPVYWDNYPVNDVAMTFELHVGPYRGRHPRLHEASKGVIANAMELFEASKIPLATIADYLADPAGYDPEASWGRAIRDVLGAANGGRDAEAFALFADNVRSSCLCTDDAPVVARALEAFAFRASQGDPAGAADDLRALAVRLLAAADHLLRGDVANGSLIDECRPWIESFELGARALNHIAELAADDRLETDGPAELLPYLARLRGARVRVFGDAVDMALADLTRTMVRPGRQLTVRGGETA